MFPVSASSDNKENEDDDCCKSCGGNTYTCHRPGFQSSCGFTCIFVRHTIVCMEKGVIGINVITFLIYWVMVSLCSWFAQQRIKKVNKMHTPELYCLDIKRSSPNHFRSLGSEVLEISLFSGPALLEDGVLAALPFPNLWGVRNPFQPAGSTGGSLLR